MMSASEQMITNEKLCTMFNHTLPSRIMNTVNKDEDQTLSQTLAGAITYSGWPVTDVLPFLQEISIEDPTARFRFAAFLGLLRNVYSLKEEIPRHSGSTSVLNELLISPDSSEVSKEDAGASEKESEDSAHIESANSSPGSAKNENVCADSMSRYTHSHSTHNHPASYPHMLCLVCKRWICARSRSIHIEAHLKYRPYSCSECNFDSRKEIMVSNHIRKTKHATEARVVTTLCPAVQQEVLRLCHLSVAVTAEILKPDSAGTIDTEFGKIDIQYYLARKPVQKRILREFNGLAAPSVRPATKTLKRSNEAEPTTDSQSSPSKKENGAEPVSTDQSTIATKHVSLSTTEVLMLLASGYFGDCSAKEVV